MNEIESLISSFINEDPIPNVRRLPTVSFMNAHEKFALQQNENVEEDDFFETQLVERAYISLRSDKRYSRYKQNEIDKMYNLVRRYIHLMGTSYLPGKTLFRIDDMSCLSIEVRYSQRADVSLNLYISEVGEDESNYEETYISYQEDGKSILANDTMEGMVTLVKKLIGV